MKLNRKNLQLGAPATERIVHIGLGAFHRAHQAWFTHKVDAENQWGIVAFTGRSPQAADELRDQDGLFTLIERGETEDRFEVIGSIVRAHDGNDMDALVAAVSNPQTAIITLTITEAGYGMDANGHVDTNNPPAALHRLAVALEARRRLHGRGLAVVSCDNIPNNGGLLKVAMTDLFGLFSSEAIRWLENRISFVSTSVDRITPKTLEQDIETVLGATGYVDNSPVVTEPFKDWILQGEFPEGRPQWQEAGAKFVTDIALFEHRKLWFLNGSHSLLAYSGSLRGHTTVAEAIADEVCRAQVEQFWAEVANLLYQPELETESYRKALIKRYSNSRIEHRLSQIAIDGATKLRVRIVPTALNEIAHGRDAAGCASVIAAWIDFVVAAGSGVQDARAEEIRAAINASNDLTQRNRALVALLSQELADSQVFMNGVQNLVAV
jgi:fructuronate reductase